MCGIAGIIEESFDNKEKTIEKMVSTLIHRGPDQDGFFVDKHVGLGMRRLSIIDVSTGKQPIWSFDRKSCIFFNGEIYNYLELRKELSEKGVQFDTHSDTEVILQMYEMYGEKMLTRLRGMFTFCIYNIETKNIFIARDYFGIKPLYYLKDKNKITAFASEIKSILAIPGFYPEINDGAIVNFLSYQYNPLDETFFKHIYKLPPAHYIKIEGGTGKTVIEKYWSFNFAEDNTLSFEKTKETIQKTLEDSVAHHMIADVPVGAFLSGGVDSSIITTLMQKVRREEKHTTHNKVKTFTVGWDSLTEGEEAKQTSDFLGTDHTEIKINPDEYFNILPKAIWHFDEPVADPSAIGLYFVAREARKHVTVVLSGEGADELFGGYNIYLEPFARQRLMWVPHRILSLILKIPFEIRGKNYVRRVIQKMEDWYIGNAVVFKPEEVEKLWKGNAERPYPIHNLYKQAGQASDSTKMQYIDIHTWLIGDILAKADKMTMANSLELRVPFLDIEVAKIARTLPDAFKWSRGVTKYILRETFKNIIPESTRNRKKLGFPTPVRDWLDESRPEIYSTILTNDYIKSHMDLDYIKNLIEGHTSKQVDNSRKIYLLLTLALWYDVFIKKNMGF